MGFFVRTYSAFGDLLKIAIYLKWPLEGLLLELCNETIHVTVLTLINNLTFIMRLSNESLILNPG